MTASTIPQKLRVLCSELIIAEGRAATLRYMSSIYTSKRPFLGFLQIVGELIFHAVTKSLNVLLRLLVAEMRCYVNTQFSWVT